MVQIQWHSPPLVSMTSRCHPPLKSHQSVDSLSQWPQTCGRPLISSNEVPTSLGLHGLCRQTPVGVLYDMLAQSQERPWHLTVRCAADLLEDHAFIVCGFALLSYPRQGLVAEHNGFRFLTECPFLVHVQRLLS